jgi:hypothetical protein
MLGPFTNRMDFDHQRRAMASGGPSAVAMTT